MSVLKVIAFTFIDQSVNFLAVLLVFSNYLKLFWSLVLFKSLFLKASSFEYFLISSIGSFWFGTQVAWAKAGIVVNYSVLVMRYSNP